MTVAPGHQYHYPLWFIIHSYRGPGPSMPPHMVYLQCIFNDFYLSLHPVTSFRFLGSHGRHAHLSFWFFWGEALQNISIKCINKMTTNAFIYGQAIIPNVSGITYVAPGHQYHYPLWFVIHSYHGPGPSMQPRTVGQMWWLWPQAIYTTTHCGSLYIVTVAQGHQCHHTWYTYNVYSMIFTFLCILWWVFAFWDPTGVTLTCLFGFLGGWHCKIFQ